MGQMKKNPLEKNFILSYIDILFIKLRAHSVSLYSGNFRRGFNYAVILSSDFDISIKPGEL